MDLDLRGKKALVTGSAGGLGFEIAAALTSEGCQVAVNGRDADRVEAVSRSLGNSVPAPGDVTDPEEARAAVGHAIDLLGRLDILVCNVGSGESVPPGQESAPEWQRVFATNLWSATNTIEAAREALVATAGAIVCISSICGSEVVLGAPLAYSAAKAALNSYVKGLARPLGAEGVRVNAVAPGNMRTPGSIWDRRLRTEPESVQAMLDREVSLRALVDPQVVADLVTYLASARSAATTGAVFVVDGGQLRS